MIQTAPWWIQILEAVRNALDRWHYWRTHRQAEHDLMVEIQTRWHIR